MIIKLENELKKNKKNEIMLMKKIDKLEKEYEQNVIDIEHLLMKKIDNLEREHEQNVIDIEKLENKNYALVKPQIEIKEQIKILENNNEIQLNNINKFEETILFRLQRLLDII